MPAGSSVDGLASRPYLASRAFLVPGLVSEMAYKVYWSGYSPAGASSISTLVNSASSERCGSLPAGA